jgi:predicted alpha-1,2-mannosidase
MFGKAGKRKLLLAGALLMVVVAVVGSIALPALQPFATLRTLIGLRGDATARSDDSDPTRYVNPFIGTDAGAPDYGFGNEGGHVFPGAGYPEGLVQWSPDTTSDAGGYRYSQPLLYGFGVRHFSGRGCSSYQDFPFMPTVGPLGISPGADWGAYSSGYSHRSESATPGNYGVHLDKPGVDVNLTVTSRTGFGLLAYPQSQDATLLVNAGGSATGNDEAGTYIHVSGGDEIIGATTSGHFCGSGNSYTLYIAARFDRPFSHFGTWQDAALNPDVRDASGAHSGAYITFDTRGNPVVKVKFGLSFVSVANARANLDAEDAGWSFNAVRDAASTAWAAKLARIRVTGGTSDEKTIFYTALYHTLFHPNVFSDANGQYIGFDKQVHTAVGYTQYENFPGWDMYRSEIRLLAVLAPHETSDMLQSLVMDAKQGGGGLPKWEVANDNSGGMVGDSGDAIIATGYEFGATSFDAAGALEAMDRGASQVGTASSGYIVRPELQDYLTLGYVPQPETGGSGSAAVTLEYTSDDFSIAQFARARGDMATYALYLRRAQNWQYLFNQQSGYIEPRHRDGSRVQGFDPISGNGYVEGDGAQYTWMVPYNLRGLFDAMGGNAAVIARLDAHFTQLNAGPNSPYALMGNEPEFEVPWEYDFAGAPYKTQQVVRRIETELFHNMPSGLVGNDDGGALSSWYVWAALGLYPEIPGVPGFVVGSPLFTSATVQLGSGHVLQITAPAAADNVPYVQGLKLNGQPYGSSWLAYSDLAAGATLDFALGATPNTTWGSDPSVAPPSFDTGQLPAYLFNAENVVRDQAPSTTAMDHPRHAYSADALSAKGLVPGGLFTYADVTFQWPYVSPGLSNNILAKGQTIPVTSAPAFGKLAFLGASFGGSAAGTGTITYSDGSTRPFTLGFSDWTLSGGAAKPSYGNQIVATTDHHFTSQGKKMQRTYLFYAAVSLEAGNTVQSVTLPTADGQGGQGEMHVFAMAFGGG